MAGLVPAISLRWARTCVAKRDARVKPAHDESLRMARALAQPLQERDHLLVLLDSRDVEQGCTLRVARVQARRILFQVRPDAIDAPGNHGDENVAPRAELQKLLAQRRVAKMRRPSEWRSVV